MPSTRPLLSLLAACVLSAASCDDLTDDGELMPGGDLVAYIRAQTPTELPPATQVGANTMGAYVHTDTGRVLFVASGIERPDPIGAESTDCPGTQTLSKEDWIDVLGRWCPRPEIGDPRAMTLGVTIYSSRMPSLTFSYDSRVIGSAKQFYQFTPTSPPAVAVDYHDPNDRVIAGTFSGTIYNEKDATDSLLITDGRFDMRY